MRIAIGTTGKDLESEISMQAGRAPYYLIIEGGKVLEVWKNPFAVGGGGAGWGVAKALADKGVEKVVVGRAGPNFTSALEERGVEIEERSGSARDAL